MFLNKRKEKERMFALLITVVGLVAYFAVGVPVVRFARKRGYVGDFEASFVLVFWPMLVFVPPYVGVQWLATGRSR